MCIRDSVNIVAWFVNDIPFVRRLRRLRTRCSLGGVVCRSQKAPSLACRVLSWPLRQASVRGRLGDSLARSSQQVHRIRGPRGYQARNSRQAVGWFQVHRPHPRRSPRRLSLIHI